MPKHNIKHLYKNPMFIFLLVIAVAIEVGFQGWRTLFNNFSIDEVGLNGFNVGVIQSIREIPGLLTFSVVFALGFVREDKFAAICLILLGIGVFSVGFFPSFLGIIFTTLLMSVGFHFYETSNQSLIIQSFSKKDSPFVFATIGSAMSATNVVVGVFIFLVADLLDFKFMYVILGGVVLIAGIWALFQNPIPKDAPQQHKKIIIKKKYWLFYLLNLLSGARRQIFVVFAVLLLVQKHSFSLKEIAILFLINNVIGIFMNPLIAKLIDRLGERFTLSLEYVFLVAIFLAYTQIDNRMIVALLYIFDHIFFNFSMGIKTYFQKIAEPRDIAPSMSMGFTINHMVAVVAPFIGGYIWLTDWRVAFYVGVGLSVLSLGFTQLVPSKKMMDLT